ncbi:DoxX-like family protein [Psychrobacillus sp. FSL W7-1457]|uniref:DoxX-like family protein n=1 Tax=unclassified Psychrobacillus TaxID=2636677 RepID=UPI0030F5CA08
MKNKPIYVETSISSDMEKVWETSQNPELHEQWDLRFSSITYLPKKEDEPQLFEYKTNIGFGFSISGWGKSVGTFHAKDNSRTSSLHFGTAQKISPIKEGKGYWKYEQGQDGIKFFTQYDYDVRFGTLGKMMDRLLFRPMMGWATALSFDVFKRWLEKGDTPSNQYVRFFSHWLITILFFFVWVYHGLVPKLILMHPEEVSMTQGMLPLTVNEAQNIVSTAGAIEIIFGLLWLLYSNKRRLLKIQVVVFPLLTLSTLIGDATVFGDPFNPLTFNLTLFVLSVIGLLVSKDIPTSKSCKRSR